MASQMVAWLMAGVLPGLPPSVLDPFVRLYRLRALVLEHPAVHAYFARTAAAAEATAAAVAAVAAAAPVPTAAATTVAAHSPPATSVVPDEEADEEAERQRRWKRQRCGGAMAQCGRV
jgi:hypothetical protein